MTDEPDSLDKPGEDGGCVIPEAVQPEALEKYLLKRSPFDGADDISMYVEGESRDERVTYLEKIIDERVLGREHEIWDVHTTGERYWVITNPTNLYSQRLFPSADYTLSFHVGLMARVASRRAPEVDDEQQDRVAAAWRRWTQAAESLDQAREAEEYQAVGMRCREALLALARDVADESMVPAGEVAPKSGDFIHWAELVANAMASGKRNAEVRSYLKSVSKSTWQLVSWLTHASHAGLDDGEIAVAATRNVLASYSLAVVRFERGIPEQCPRCSSYRVSTVYVGDMSETVPYAPVCKSCGWSNARVDGIDADAADTESNER